MKSAPYGSWPSPITAKMAAVGSTPFSEIKLAGEKIYWLEGRPEEKGRMTLMSWSEQEGEKELLPKEYNVRTRVHEYGGGALLLADHRIYFIDDKDQQIHCLLPNGTVEKITSREKARFADGSKSVANRSLFYVMEEHGKEVVNSIVKVDPFTGHIRSVASGHDFYSNPRVSPDGLHLAYITWDHPNMPWDGTQLWVLDLKTSKARFVAGGVSESIADPQWSPDGELYFVSDRTNWWNIYREKEQIPLWAIAGEFIVPQWLFGRSLVGFSDDGIVCSYVKSGVHTFARISLGGNRQPMEFPYTCVKSLVVENQRMAMIASSPNQPSSIILCDLKNGKNTLVKCSRKKLIDPEYISYPQAIEFPTSGGRIAHAFYYPPCNPKFCGMPGEKPPLLVESHGGPTANAYPCFSPDVLYWTSRGFAVVSVNYGGSTGYGRIYRDSLKDQWGVVDVDDCTNAALYCVEQGLADRNRLAIEGGSAGGFTTLAVLAFRDVFKVGADHFGVSDLEGLALDTHKFEARYLDQLVGSYPEKRDLYIERSPLHSVSNIKCPVIIFQGAEDAIVPPSQSEAMFKSLKARGIPTTYLLFEGEQHGFRKAENIQRTLEAQLYFFSKILKFPLNEEIEPVEIENLPRELQN